MFSFFRSSKVYAPVPEWANYLNEKQYDKFLKILNDYFASQKIPYSLGDGVIDLDDTSFGADKLGLVNLAQICQLTPSFKWKKVVSSHFDGMRKSKVFQEEFEKKVHDFSFAREYIAVRLYHVDYIASIDQSNTIGKLITEDIFATLVFDFPDSVINIQPTQTIQWPKNNEELFEIGVENVKRKYKFSISSKKIEGFKIRVVQGNHFFTPNIIFDLDNYAELSGAKGALVGIPHRHAVLVYKIENLQIIKVMNLFIPFISKMNEEGPGSISNNLFWYYNGQFTTIPYTLDENTLQLSPPEEFVELLNTLEGDAG